MSTAPGTIVPDPTARSLADFAEPRSSEWAFEDSTVTAAARLIHELQRATNPAVLAAQSAWWAATSRALTSASSSDPYAAMSTAASGFGALGQAPGETYEVLRHACGADGFYRYNVSTSWKKTTAAAHGLDPDDPTTYADPGSPVYNIWAEEVGSSSAPIDSATLDADSLANPAGDWGWWSPSERLDISSSGSREQGNADFFTVCQIVSLAPDWYPWGLVGFSYGPPASTELKRPEPYDGANPLWVQRPADEPARTGGGVVEVLVGSEISIDQLSPIPAWIPTVAALEAIQQAPSVNTYADDLLLAWRGADTEAKQRVAFWQTTVVEQCRSSRAGADARFNAQAAGQATGGRAHG